MAKKRSSPHGRTVPKGKKAKTRTYRPLAAVPQPEETASLPASPTPPPAPSYLPRSAPRTGFGAPRTSYSTRTLRGGATGLSTDYNYVISDLKRIGVLAAATFAVLIGLALMIK